MQKAAEHKSSWFAVNDNFLAELMLLIFSIDSKLFSVFIYSFVNFALPMYGVLSCLLIKFTLHKHIKEVTNTGLIGELEGNVYCPEKRMLPWTFNIRERNQI